MNDLSRGAGALAAYNRKQFRATFSVLTIGTWSMLVVGGALLTGRAQAATIDIPNASFESPPTTFADPRIDYWQKVPTPFWYDESGGFAWEQLAGAFLNTAPGTTNHIDNMDGNQAVFLFAVPQVELFQDYDSPGPTNGTPSHAFDAKFEVGKSYRLTFDLIGGGGNMLDGVSLQAALYYKDNPTNRITVAATNVVYSPAVFTNQTHFQEIQLTVPTVQAGDPWANQNIGVQFLSTVATNLVGGYWDLDNVRLTSEGGSDSSVSLTGSSWTGAGFSFIVQSAPGQRVEIVGADNLAAPVAQWVSLGTITNLTGSSVFTDSVTNLQQRFYQARPLP